MLIAIDTSTSQASLALAREGEVLAELSWQCRQNHATQLLPRLTQLLDMVEADLPAATGIIVAIGPGSFNGLRVGVSTAKGLAFSLNIPVVGISTLAAAAYAHAATGLPICPILNAGRSEIATATYQQQADGWHQTVAEHITTLDTLCQQIGSQTTFCGELTPTQITGIKKRLGVKAIIPPTPARLRRAAFLAELGQQRLKKGDYDQPTTLQPLYLRKPAITKPKQKIKNLGD